MKDAIFPVYSAIAIVLLVISAGPHFRAGNIGAISLVIWCLLANVTYFIDALVYWDTVANITPVWCDIVVKIQSAVQTGLAVSCLCINRRLAAISSPRRSVVSASSRQWAFWSDLAICLIAPLLILLVSYFVQAHRYNIIENFGCFAATWLDIYAILGLFVPPVLLGAMSFICGGIAIYNFIIQRRRFQAVLQQSSSSLNTSRFCRLIGVAAIDMLLSVPFGIYEIVHSSHSIQPAYTWAEVHTNFSVIQIVDDATIALRSSFWISVNLSRWMTTLAAFVYFAFFGMHEDALAGYGYVWEKARDVAAVIKSKIFGVRRPSVLKPSELPQLGTAIASPSEFGWGRKMMEDEDQGFAYDSSAGLEKVDHSFSSSSQIAVRVEVQREVS